MSRVCMTSMCHRHRQYLSVFLFYFLRPICYALCYICLQCELRCNCSLWEVFPHSLHICHQYTVSTSYLSRDVSYFLHRCLDKVKVAIWWHFAFRGRTAVRAIRLHAEHYSFCTRRDWTFLKLPTTVPFSIQDAVFWWYTYGRGHCKWIPIYSVPNYSSEILGSPNFGTFGPLALVS